MKKQEIKRAALSVLLLIAVLFSTGFTAGCAGHSGKAAAAEADGSEKAISFLGTEENAAAEGFSVSGFRSSGGALRTVIDVRGDRAYLLIEENDRMYSHGQLLKGNTAAPYESAFHALDGDIPFSEKQIIVLKRPLDTMYLANSAAYAFFSRLQKQELLRYSGLRQQDWMLADAREQMRTGKLLFAGRYSAPDFEHLLSGGCRLALENTMIYHRPQILEKLEMLGIPVFVDKANLEKTACGRTEWIRVYGHITGQQAEAEAWFRETVRQEERLRSGTPDDDRRPGVVYFYVNAAGQILMRNPEDYISDMITVSGGRYLFPESRRAYGSVNIPIDAEVFSDIAKDADLFIYSGTIGQAPENIEALIGKHTVFSHLKAVKEGHVYVTDSSFFQASDSCLQFMEDLQNIYAGRDEASVFIHRLSSGGFEGR